MPSTTAVPTAPTNGIFFATAFPLLSSSPPSFLRKSAPSFAIECNFSLVPEAVLLIAVLASSAFDFNVSNASDAVCFNVFAFSDIVDLARSIMLGLSTTTFLFGFVSTVVF